MPPRKRKAEVEAPEKETTTNYPDGVTEDLYGRTNHAMTADEVARAALAEGTLRPDGRPKQSLFYDDVLAAEQQRMRDYIENQGWEKDGSRVDLTAIAANTHPVVAERGEPLVSGSLITSTADLNAAEDLRKSAGVEGAGDPTYTPGDAEKGKHEASVKAEESEPKSSTAKAPEGE
jgi:hypothetical protein